MMAPALDRTLAMLVGKTRTQTHSSKHDDANNTRNQIRYRSPVNQGVPKRKNIGWPRDNGKLLRIEQARTTEKLLDICHRIQDAAACQISE